MHDKPYSVAFKKTAGQNGKYFQVRASDSLTFKLIVADSTHAVSKMAQWEYWS